MIHEFPVIEYLKWRPDDINHLPPKPPRTLDSETKLLLVVTFVLFVLLVATYR